MPVVKNRGPKLTDTLQGQLEFLPPWVRATVKIIRTHQTGVEPKEEPPPLAEGLVESSAVQETRDERREVLVYLDPAQLPKTRTGQTVLPTGQVAATTDTASNEQLILTPDATLVDGEVEQIGGVYLRRETVAPVFPNDLYRVERPDLLPQEFRGAIPTSTTAITSAGTASMPTLGAGQLASQNEQVRENWVRSTVEARNVASFPVILSGGEIVTDYQLKASVIRTANLGVLTLVVDEFTQPGSRVDNLGDGIFVKNEVRTTEVPSNKLWRKVRDEVTPLVFRALIPLNVVREDVAGTAANPTLLTGEVEKSEEQTTKHIKRTQVATRAGVTLPQSVTDSVITPEGQVGTRVRTLDTGVQTITPDANLKEGRVETLGDGTSEKTTVVVPDVFGNEVFQKERPDVTPAVFKATIPQETTRVDSAGVAVMPMLAAGDVSKTSRQKTEFVKEDTTVTRAGATLPSSVTDSIITPEGQVGTRVRTLDAGVQTITPNANLKEGQVEVLGDGTSEKTTVVVPSVFGNQVFQKERPDVTPQVFKATIPQETTRVDSAGTAAMPTLSAGDVSKTSRQKTEFIKEDTTVTRAGVTLPQTVTDSIMTPEQQVGTRTRTLDTGVQTFTPTATTKEVQVEVLGDGTSEKTMVVVPTVFGKQLFSVERPEVLPLAFRSAVPLVTTRLEEAGVASMPTLGVNDIEKSMRQVTEFVREVTTRTRTLPGSFPTLTLRSWDSDLRNEILTVMNVVAMGSAYTPGTDVVDYDEKELDDNFSLRIEYKLPGGTLPASYDTREPGQRTFPALLTDITTNLVALADTAAGDDRFEVVWFPVWRPGFTIDVNYIITTSFHAFASPPAPDTVYVIRTNDIVYKGVSFQVSLPGVLNDAFSAGVTFSSDGLYGNLSETFSVAASVPSASSYTSDIGSTQVIASKVQPWRRLWVKRTTKLVLL